MLVEVQRFLALVFAQKKPESQSLIQADSSSKLSRVALGDFKFQGMPVGHRGKSVSRLSQALCHDSANPTAATSVLSGNGREEEAGVMLLRV